MHLIKKGEDNNIFWIKALPSGIYTIPELKKFSGIKHHSAIKRIMLKYGAKIECIEVLNSNLFKKIFRWEGFQEKIS